MGELQDKIRQIVDKEVLNAGAELIDINIVGQSQIGLVQVLVDKQGGITIEECANLNEELSRALDGTDILKNKYTLEVSSPGLDRSLKTEKDFKWSIGKLAKIITRIPVNKQNVFRGKILGIRDNVLDLENQDAQILKIDLNNIIKARLEVRWSL